jgi:hypothetical protein
MRNSAWRSRFSGPLTRSTILSAIFIMLFLQVVCSWAFLRFVHARAQYRSLAPELYDVEVLTVDDYRRLSDPAQREVKLSDGRTVIKAAIWDKLMPQKYKATGDGNHYVLVTTKGTAHVLGYVEPYFILFGFAAICGVLAGLWNQVLVARERGEKDSPAVT